MAKGSPAVRVAGALAFVIGVFLVYTSIPSVSASGVVASTTMSTQVFGPVPPPNTPYGLVDISSAPYATFQFYNGQTNAEYALTITNSQGMAELNLPYGGYTWTASAAGYQGDYGTLTVVTPNQNFDVVMSRSTSSTTTSTTSSSLSSSTVTSMTSSCSAATCPPSLKQHLDWLWLIIGLILTATGLYLVVKPPW